MTPSEPIDYIMIGFMLACAFWIVGIAAYQAGQINKKEKNDK